MEDTRYLEGEKYIYVSLDLIVQDIIPHKSAMYFVTSGVNQVYCFQSKLS